MIAPIPEIQVAVKFIVSCMYGKLPRRRADLFAEELSSAIQTKFQVRHKQLDKLELSSSPDLRCFNSNH